MSNGPAWKRQREIAETQVLPRVLGGETPFKLATQVSECLVLRLKNKLHSSGTQPGPKIQFKVDIKQELEDSVSQWIVGLVLGNHAMLDFKTIFLKSWRQIRSKKTACKQGLFSFPRSSNAASALEGSNALVAAIRNCVEVAVQKKCIISKSSGQNCAVACRSDGICEENNSSTTDSGGSNRCKQTAIGNTCPCLLDALIESDFACTLNTHPRSVGSQTESHQQWHNQQQCKVEIEANCMSFLMVRLVYVCTVQKFLWPP
jgi:hypothetical protein